MKKTGIALLVCAGLVFVGAGTAFAGWMMGGATSVNFNSTGLHINGGRNASPDSSVQSDSKSFDSFESMNISTVSEDITLIESDHYGIEYKVPSEYKIKECGVSNGELRFSYEVTMGFNFFNWNFGNEPVYVKVYYPKGAEMKNVSLSSTSGYMDAANLNIRENLETDTTSGDVKLADMKIGGKVTLGSTSGYFSISNVEAGAFSMSSTSGNLQAERLSVAGKLYAGSTSGYLNLTSSQAADMEFDTTSGDISMEDCSTGSVNSGSTSGSFTGSGSISDGFRSDSVSGGVKFNGSLAGECVIGSTSGGVQLTLTNKEAEFSYSLDTTSGDIRVNGDKREERNTDAPNSIRADTVSGNISIDFAA